MMNMKMNPYVRYGILAVLLSLFLFSLYQVVTTFLQSGKVEAEEPAYTYEQSGQISYDVALKPDELFQQITMPEENQYLLNFIDHINTTFQFDWKGENESTLTGTYEAYAVLEGYLGDEKGQNSIWKKEYPLIQETPFEETSQQLHLEKPYTLRLQTFNEFINKVNEASDVNAQTELTIYWTVNLNGQNNEGTLNETSTSTMILPLNGNLLTVQGDLNQQKQGAINKTVLVNRPNHTAKLWGFSASSLITLVMMLGVLYFTKSRVENDLFKKERNGIFKKYGARMVELQDSHLAVNSSSIKVKTFEDLVRLSDDLVHPILYHEAQSSLISFFVFTENKVYTYELSNGINETDDYYHEETGS